jgi:hypothetical protein
VSTIQVGHAIRIVDIVGLQKTSVPAARERCIRGAALDYYSATFGYVARYYLQLSYGLHS